MKGCRLGGSRDLMPSWLLHRSMFDGAGRMRGARLHHHLRIIHVLPKSQREGGRKKAAFVFPSLASEEPAPS